MAAEQNGDKSSYQILKDLIFDRKITAGQRLTETYLSKLMNMSRIPVREAMQLLTYEGFIERSGNNGYKIKEYNEQDIINIYCYREALDGMLARLFAQRVDESQLYYLELNLEAMQEQFEASAEHSVFPKLDLDFHRIIARGARNEFMEHQLEINLEKVIFIAEGLHESGSTGQSHIFDELGYAGILEQHEKIYNAIKARNFDKAEAAARESVRAGLRKALIYHSRK